MKFEEQWVIRGNQPVLWNIPFWLTWDKGEKEATIYYAVNLLAIQEEAVDRLLRTAARRFNGMWRITKADLERLGRRVDPPVSPEKLLAWERSKEYQKPENQPERVEEINDFVDALYQRGIGQNREEVAFWWRQFCNHMLDWLLMKEKPVDMGFIRLHATPYRWNWKLILLGKFPEWGMSTSVFKAPDLEYLKRKSGFLEAMLSADMLAMKRKHNYCYRNVEVEFKKSWFISVEKVERERRRHLGPFAYTTHVMDQIRRSLKPMYKIYTQWLALIARPSAIAVPGHWRGLFRVVPKSARSKIPVSVHKAWVLDPVVPNKLPALTPASIKDDVFEPPKTVSEVPGIQQDPEVLREHRPDVQQSGDWQI